MKDSVMTIDQKMRKLDTQEYRNMASAFTAAREKDEVRNESVERAGKRQSAVDSLRKLLRIEVINASTITLLTSPAYKAYMAERIMTKLVTRKSETIAAMFNKAFFLQQFTRRAVAAMYWGEDNR